MKKMRNKKISDYFPPESRSLTKTEKKIHGYVPPEIIEQILCRLPVKSVVKCTAVCKSWYALIKRPSFISAHLQQAASSPYDDLILLCFHEYDLETAYYLYRDNDAFEEYKQFRVPSEPEVDDSFIVGACNGLICLIAPLRRGDSSIILWNPSIQKHFIVPEPDSPKPDLPPESFSFSALGFGFDPVSNDYKVLIIVPVSVTEDLAQVWLFSLNRCSWTRLSDIFPNYSCYRLSSAVFAKGALHFDLSARTILVFDISSEKFFVINIPDALLHFASGTYLIKYEESIALVTCGRSNYDHEGQRELWVMKEYGVDSSWAKVFYSIDENGEFVFGTEVITVFEVRKKGRLFLNVTGGRHYGEVATLDLNYHQQEHQKQQQLKCLGGPDECEYLFFGSYMESLVLLDKGEEDFVEDYDEFPIFE